MRVPRVRIVPAIALLCLGCLIKPKPENQRMQLGQDVLVSGSAPNLYSDSIAGDAIMAGGDIHFGGSTGGDLVAAGGQQDIHGRIHGSLRAAGGNVTVGAVIDRNATIGGGNITLETLGAVAGNAYLIAGKAIVNGSVRGGMLATGGQIELNGPIGQDVEIVSDELSVGPHTQIGGNLRYRVKGKVHIDPGARITGKVTALPAPTGPGPFTWAWLAGTLLMWVVVILLAPGFMTAAAEVVHQRAVRAIIVGVVVGILGLVVISIAAFTVVGLPLALLAAVVYVILGFALSDVPVALWLGGLIVRARTGARPNTLPSFFIGALILLVLGFLPIIGGVVRVVAGCIGFGALLIAAWAARRPAAV